MPGPDQSVTALMPVHRGIDPRHLSLAIESVFAQTTTPDEFVIVEDGPLTEQQAAVLDSVEQQNAQVRRVRLTTNQGAGVANQAGLVVALGTWIMKVDADDINVPHRLSTQLTECKRRSLDVCGAAMLEFDRDPDHPIRIRRSPESSHEIGRRVRFNNPMNHPTTLYRRELALGVGGYPTMRYMQDYDLFARMVASGAKMANLPEPLVHFRSGRSMRRRRRGLEILRLEWELQRRLRSYGLVGWARTIRNLGVRVAFRLLPDSGSRLVYGHILSRPVAPVARSPHESS